MSMPQFVSFLSDYGRTDEFVGVCHAVMLDIAPALRIVDVTHDIPPFDVRAVEVENAVLVGPDNGLLAPAVAMLGGPRRVHELTATQYQLAAPGPTFAGRDVMAPAAAYLATGVPIGDLGPEVDPVRLTPAIVPLPDDDGEGRIAGEVLWVDRYGNCQLNIAPEQLHAAGVQEGGALEVTVVDAAGARSGRRARWVRAFADAKPSELVVLVDSYGMCTLALDRRSAAAELGVRNGSTVTVAIEGAPAITEPGVPVAFGREQGR
jgi:S-adenosylmethionine hydrolase